MDKKSVTIVVRVLCVEQLEKEGLGAAHLDAGAQIDLMEISRNDGLLCPWAPMLLKHRTSELNGLGLRRDDVLEITVRKAVGY